nr:response regulator [Geothrix terrae]
MGFGHGTSGVRPRGARARDPVYPSPVPDRGPPGPDLTTFQTALVGRQCRERPGRLPFPGASVKILVVDDSPTMRRIIIGNLVRMGHAEVLEAEDGLAGLEKLDQGGVDLIITDWDMPEMDGIAFARAVRSRGATMPILMVTTHAATQDIVQALEAGVNTYVVKPFTQESLREKIDSLLG